MKVVKVSAIIAALEADGWVKTAQRGSHRQFKHPTKKGESNCQWSPEWRHLRIPS